MPLQLRSQQSKGVDIRVNVRIWELPAADDAFQAQAGGTIFASLVFLSVFARMLDAPSATVAVDCGQVLPHDHHNASRSERRI